VWLRLLKLSLNASPEELPTCKNASSLSYPQVIKLACFVMNQIMFALSKATDQNQYKGVNCTDLSLQLVLPAQVICTDNQVENVITTGN
jgi:hypothetical protein